MDFAQKQRLSRIVKLIVIVAVGLAVWRHYGHSIEKKIDTLPSPTEGFKKPDKWDNRLNNAIKCDTQDNCTRKNTD